MSAKDNPISAIIIPWGAALGVAYRYDDGLYDAHAIEAPDWAVLAQLDRGGCLMFINERILSPRG